MTDHHIDQPGAAGADEAPAVPPPSQTTQTHFIFIRNVTGDQARELLRSIRRQSRILHMEVRGSDPEGETGRLPP